ncbi:response regulator [Microlunatus parietis]|uniref:DNA-binding NarL/FixJ family response regulator n=1 Tax=Microlunatus parietis TaxID=682979 RepID=A0A7Y9I8L5_9ACTN|nr:response regulator transcription factor [Microlunatus parietis]NYE72339.1 DNA-binding NarL/FixJ family response regulator [Microlunatus parietis]
MIKVLLADDQESARIGLTQLLAAAADLEVVGAAVDGRDLLDRTRRLAPDVVVTDLRMPGMSGIVAIERLMESTPRPAVIALTTFDTDEHLYGALRAGAVGFLLKDSDPALLVDAVRVAYDGQGLIDPQVTRRLVTRFAATSPRPTPPLAEPLTPRETEVLTGIARGWSNAEIAEALVITTGTAKIHVARVLTKLGVGTRVQAAIFAHRHGLVTWSELD